MNVRAIVQRVREASVTVEGRLCGAIGRGILVLAGMHASDGAEDRDWLARKVVQMRIFDDAAGLMNLALREVDGEILAVSQFTLYASTRKGNRPSWSAAAPPAVAQPMFEEFVAALAREHGREIATGVFGANMSVALVNDGPVTILLDSRMRE